jgi:polyisoprenoid-binding protein YceI
MEQGRSTMKSSGLRRNLFNYLLVLFLGIVFVTSAAPGAQQAGQPQKGGQLAFVLDQEKSHVHWTLGTTLHTVHGTFALKPGTVKLDLGPKKASGEIAAYATSGESGNDSRDKKMHKDVLESDKFPDIIFRPDRFEGAVAAQGASSVQLHGTFVLHGAEHELTVPMNAELKADHWTATGKFAVPFLQWGLKNPSNFLLKVEPNVNIELQFEGKLENSSPSAD